MFEQYQLELPQQVLVQPLQQLLLLVHFLEESD